jgi:predicted MFS family arabinose efflux permease
VATLVAPETSYWLVGPALFLIGLGLGAALVPSTDAVMAAVPGESAGLGSAINDSGRQVGTALGIRILGPVSSTPAGVQDLRLRPRLSEPNTWSSDDQRPVRVSAPLRL